MTESNPSAEVNYAPKRHWLYGFNVVLLVIVGCMILSFLLVAADRTKGKADWDMTSNGANSLSGSTKKLLKDISDHKQNFHIVSLYTDPSNEEKTKGDPNNQAEKRKQVMDLLTLYHNNCSNIQVDDWGDKARDDIEKEVRDKYAGELKPYETAVKDFDPVAKELRDFSTQEAEHIAAAVAQIKATPEELDSAGQLQSQFRQMPSMLDDLQDEIHHETDSTLPDWKQVTDGIKQLVDTLQANITLLSDPAKVKQLDVPPALLPYFTEANDRYKKLGATLTTYLAELNKLQPLKVQDILSGLGRNTIVVLGPDQAKVLHAWDIYADAPTAQDSPPSSTPMTIFKGEELISSSLLAMARPEKVKVVYVTTTPQQYSTGLYSEMTKQLQQANFDVQDWSPPTDPSSPDTGPPAQGKGVVWVVFPPDAPSGQAMFSPPPDPKPVIDAVKKHMAAGGDVMFLAEASGVNPMGGSDKYAYDDLLQPFGIQVKPKYTVVDLTDQANDATGDRTLRYAPYITIDTYENHPITAPIQSLPTAFFPANAITVVDVAKSPPTGADPKVIVKTPYATEYWGETDFSAPPKFDPQNDLAAPVPLSAVSTLHKGQPDEQRVVVVGCRYIGADPVLNAAQQAVVGNQLVEFKVFPGNQEFMKNSILWLAGYENMIAVSSNSNAAQRFVVGPTGLAWLRVTAVLFAPLLVLALGALIWVVRHR